MSVEVSERSLEEAIECGLLQHGPDACADDATGLRETSRPYGDVTWDFYRRRRPEDYDCSRCLLPRDVTLVEGLFYGLKPAVVAVVVEAVIRIGKRSLKNGVMVGVAAAAFVAIFFFQVPFPLIVLAAGIVGYIGGKVAPDTFAVIKERTANDGAVNQHVISDEMAAAVRPSLARTMTRLTNVDEG